jgi:predicted Zn finger-like uncharacterized protein
MHVECSACGARYTIADEKIPPQGARVRCRKCHAVFSVERAESAPSPVGLPLIPPSPQAHPVPRAPADRPSPESEFTRGFDHLSGFAAPAPASHVAPAAASRTAPSPDPGAGRPHAGTPAAAPAPASPAAAPAPASSAPAVASVPGRPDPAAASTGIPEGLSDAERTRHERARRLARVLASDIAVYNKEKRERGIREGNLVAILGYEIKKSWEVYKERVTPEMANSTPYFRDALNEMLADGKKIF